MIRALTDFASLGAEAVNWSGGGEPTVHPSFPEFVAHAASVGLKQGIFTNAYREVPHQDLFSWIRVSWTERGLGPVKRPHVPFGMRLNHTREYTKADLIDFCTKSKEFGASYFQITPALELSHLDQPALDVPYFLKEYEDDRFSVHINEYKYKDATKPRGYSDCYGYHLCPSIDWHGHITVCLYMTLDKEFELGDLNKESLLDIWPRIIAKAPVVAKCQNCCKNNSINKAMITAKNVSETSFL